MPKLLTLLQQKMLEKGQRVGYLRVSSLDQNEGRQLEGIELDRSFLDKASGGDINRPQLVALLAFVREGDTVICHSMTGSAATSTICENWSPV